MKQDLLLVQKIIEKLNIAELNEMQLASLTANKNKEDIIILSPTGSGKTLAFLLPVLLQLEADKKGIQALIIAPSRELALQIEKVFRSMGTDYKVNCFYGGHDARIEKNNLTEPPAVLIGTPGRIADHLRKNNFDTHSIRLLVLDEFDKALELGFEAEMKYIIGQLPKLKKRILTSATNAGDIPAFTGIENPITINFLDEKTPEGLSVKVVKAEGKDKTESLFKLVCKIGHEPTLIFCNHRDALLRISDFFSKKGLVHDVYHGKMDQQKRFLSLLKFRNGSNKILVTTDLASRGLDIDIMKNVVHYQLPPAENIFTHRNGRTARMKETGTAYLLMAETEYLPPYILEKPEEEQLPQLPVLPAQPEFTTLLIGGGKKEKINKIDIVGLLLKKGGLQNTELGLIEVTDHYSYAAVKKNKVKKLVEILKNERIKGFKIKVDVAVGISV